MLFQLESTIPHVTQRTLNNLHQTCTKSLTYFSRYDHSQSTHVAFIGRVLCRASSVHTVLAEIDAACLRVVQMNINGFIES